jgi:hypothetical protein
MEILAARPRASTIGCRFVDHAAAQAEREHAVITQLPDPPLGIPRSTGLLHPLAEGHFREGDADPDDLVVREASPWRFPIAFGNEKLHGFEPLLPLRIVAIAHADEAVTVLREELLRAFLAWLEMQPYPRGSSGARLVDRGRGSAPAAFRQHRVRERKLPENAGLQRLALCPPRG